MTEKRTVAETRVLHDAPRRLEIERLCTEFEQSWEGDSRRSISEVLKDADPGIRADLVVELVAIECELRSKQGDRPSRDAYLEELSGWKAQADRGYSIWASPSFDDTVVSAGSVPISGPVPQQLGDYRIVRQIGKGGMGVVFEAVQESLGRRVAIKTLTQTNILSLVTRFQREARAVAMLHHTNIVEVFGSGVHNGTPYIAMQLIDGHSLSEMIREAQDVRSQGSASHVLFGASGQQYVAKIGLQVAEALQHAHQVGVLHRDIKPANLLVDQNSNAWVSDFGLAKLSEDDSDATVAGSIIGTLRYLPPESFDGDWDERADVYALGLTLYEALALKPAFVENDHRQLIDRITSKKPAESLRAFDTQVPLDLATIVAKAVSPEPNARYQSAGLLADDLRCYLNGQPIAARPASAAEKLWKWSKRKPALAGFLSLILLVVTVGLPTMALLWRRAELARRDAEDQRASAVAAQKDATLAAKQARVAQAEALDEKRKAEQTSEAAEAARYGSSMMLAQKHLEDGDAGQLQRLLNEWVPIQGQPGAIDRRGWEWDYLNQQLDRSTLSLSTNAYVWAVALRPDGAQIAAIVGTDVNGSDRPTAVHIWDAETGALVHSLREKSSRVFGLAYSPDGTQIATMGFTLEDKGARGTLSTWDSSTGEKSNSITLPGSFNAKNINGFLGVNYFPNVVYSADGKHILISPQPVELLDSQSLESVWNGKTVWGRSAWFGKDGEVIGSINQKIHVYDREFGKRQSTSPCGKTLRRFYASDDGTVFSAMTPDEKLRVSATADFVEYEEHTMPGITWGAVSRDAQWIVMGDRGGAITIKSRAGHVPDATLTGHFTTISDGAFSQDGKWLVTSSLDGTIKKWNLDSVLRETPLVMKVPDVTEIAFSENGENIVFTGRNMPSRDSAGSLSLNNQEQSTSKISTTYRNHWPRGDFEFSHDGSLLVAPYEEKQVPENIMGRSASGRFGIWSSDNWKEMAVVDVDLATVNCFGWNENDRILAVGGIVKSTKNPLLSTLAGDAGSKVLFYRISVDQPLVAKLVGEIPVGGAVLAVTIRGDVVAVADEDSVSIGVIQEDWESETESLSVTKRHAISDAFWVVSMDLSPDGSRLATVSYGQETFQTYNTETGEEVYKHPAPRGARHIRFSPDGKRVACVGMDSEIRFCDAKTGNQLLTLYGSDSSSGTRPVNARVVFSPDGRRIATNNLRRQVRIWEVQHKSSEGIVP